MSTVLSRKNIRYVLRPFFLSSCADGLAWIAGTGSSPANGRSISRWETHKSVRWGAARERGAQVSQRRLDTRLRDDRP